MTLRLSCTGSGPARLTDGPFKTTSADATIGLATGPDTHWKLVLYLE